MSLEQTNALIDHLDNSYEALAGQAPHPTFDELERRIAEDEDIAKEWNYLKLAVDAVQDAGLNEQVAAVRQQYEIQEAAQETSKVMDEKPAGGNVRNLYRNAMRIAACAVLVAGGACIFKYVRLSSSSLYSEYYTSYELNTNRGSADTMDAMEQAYASRSWSEVLASFSAGKGRSNKADFLAGMADLELKKFDDAIAHFEQVIANNSQARTDYFEDDAEYYLAISWLAKDKVNEAMPILEKIRGNKNHLYNAKVNKMSFTDLRLVQYKENK